MEPSPERLPLHCVQGSKALSRRWLGVLICPFSISLPVSDLLNLPRRRCHLQNKVLLLHFFQIRDDGNICKERRRLSGPQHTGSGQLLRLLWIHLPHPAGGCALGVEWSLWPPGVPGIGLWYQTRAHVRIKSGARRVARAWNPSGLGAEAGGS